MARGVCCVVTGRRSWKAAWRRPTHTVNVLNCLIQYDIQRTIKSTKYTFNCGDGAEQYMVNGCAAGAYNDRCAKQQQCTSTQT